MSHTFYQLQGVLDHRKGLLKSANSEETESYVVSLHKKGLNKILEKVGEESTEVILAAKDLAASESLAQHDSEIGETSPQVAQLALQSELAGEVADLWFHSLVMLSHLDMSFSDVEQVIAKRFGLSGIDEKRQRSSKHVSE